MREERGHLVYDADCGFCTRSAHPRIAANRHRMPGGTPACRIEPPKDRP